MQAGLPQKVPEQTASTVARQLFLWWHLSLTSCFSPLPPVEIAAAGAEGQKPACSARRVLRRRLVIQDRQIQLPSGPALPRKVRLPRPSCCGRAVDDALRKGAGQKRIPLGVTAAAADSQRVRCGQSAHGVPRHHRLWLLRHHEVCPSADPAVPSSTTPAQSAFRRERMPVLLQRIAVLRCAMQASHLPCKACIAARIWGNLTRIFLIRSSLLQRCLLCDMNQMSCGGRLPPVFSSQQSLAASHACRLPLIVVFFCAAARKPTRLQRGTPL